MILTEYIDGSDSARPAKFMVKMTVEGMIRRPSLTLLDSKEIFLTEHCDQQALKDLSVSWSTKEAFYPEYLVTLRLDIISGLQEVLRRGSENEDSQVLLGIERDLQKGFLAVFACSNYLRKTEVRLRWSCYSNQPPMIFSNNRSSDSRENQSLFV